MQIHELESIFDQVKVKLSPEKISQKIESLKQIQSDPNNWENQEMLTKTSQDLKHLETKLDQINKIEDSIKFLKEFHQEIPQNDLESQIKDINDLLQELEIQTLLNQKYDESDCIVSVYSGAGGDDAEDFTRMLLEMYEKYAKNFDFSAKIIDASYTQSGIKHASIKIQGPYAYGYLKQEHGVHRLVRLSPFNSGNTRETSFALVEVLPVIENNETLKIDPSDLRIDTFKSSGPGGQSVNTTDSAVRITHLPTKIQASSQSERSQHQNKENAMQILASKLTQLMEQQQKDNLDELKGDSKQISFGSQIRSYVLHPYKLVKDHRSNYEDKNPDNVFNGHIQSIIYSVLNQN